MDIKVGGHHTAFSRELGTACKYRPLQFTEEEDFFSCARSKFKSAIGYVKMTSSPFGALRLCTLQ